MIEIVSKSNIVNKFEHYADLDNVDMENIDNLTVCAIDYAVTNYNCSITSIDDVSLDFLTNDIDVILSRYVDSIIHNDEFQELESIWCSIEHLIESYKSEDNDNAVVVSVIDADKETLKVDFESHEDIKTTRLYREIYELEYNMPGGIPYSVVVSNFKFNNISSDFDMLGKIAKIASLSHCPFIASIAPGFLGVTDFNDLYSISNFSNYMKQPHFNLMQRMRALEVSKYIGLTMPDYIIRKPYGGLNPTALFNYNESVESDSDYTWAVTSFLLASNIIKSYIEYGAISHIRGPTSGGMITSLPSLGLLPSFSSNSFRLATQVMLSETLEKNLSDSGVISFSLYKSNDKGCFFSLSSMNKPAMYSDPRDTANAKINSQLSYILLMSRIAHHLKVIHRESIGNVSTKEDLSKSLNGWLSGMITRMPDPNLELIAKRPLRDAKVEVNDIEDDPGNFSIDIYVVPHLQLEGVDIRLTLVSKFPKDKSL